ncbi:MAG TPA: CFI-box-CTERM domain-containing protein [Nitrosopumilaceae archaeon]|nr:CFI-box-CTERM domain-containing protein [Nitrosopumilaceae archaeon]
MSLVLVLLPLLTLPVFGQISSQQIKLTSGGTIKVGFSTDPANPNPGDQTQLKISFINKQTNAIQPHIDYRVTVTQGQNQIFGIPITHTAEGSVSIPYQFQNAGDYQVTVSVEGILFQPISPETAVFPITIGGSPPPSQPKSGCLIATAAFGSELAPQVQFLREYRDNTIMTTVAGSSFLNAFNTVYYSFSPTVADAERTHPLLQETVRAGISPLLGILQMAKFLTIGNNNLSVILSGIMASSLIGATYLWPAGLAVKSIRESKKLNTKIIIAIISGVLFLTLISIVTGNSQFIMVTTSATVLTFVGLGAIYSSWAIAKIMRKANTFL